MTEQDNAAPTLTEQRQEQLAQWDNEGGAPSTPVTALPAAQAGPEDEALVSLRVRVIALENLLIAVLAHASPAQLDKAGELATHIAPHGDTVPHPLNEQAAHAMNDLVRRALAFRDGVVS